MARASRTSQARAARQAKMLYDMCAMAIVAGRADLDGAYEVGFDIELPMFTVGRAGELANVHPQTLRQYDRLGLVVPQRTDGGARRYSLRDISRLAKAQQLSQEEGINLAGIARILSLEEENRELRRQVERLRRPAGSRPMRTVTLWKSNVPAALACGVGRFRSTPVSCRRASPWRPRVSRLMRMTRAVGVSQAKTRGLRGVNPFLSRFLGLSCFGGLTDFQKTLKKKFKNRHIWQQMCLFLLYSFTKCIASCDDVVVVGNNVEYPRSNCHSSGRQGASVKDGSLCP